jgi:tetratricopeptide (TPR) repeat protein
MTLLRRKVLISLSILLILPLSSCGWVKRTQPKCSPSEARQEWEKRIQPKCSLSEARQDLMSGHFQKALDAYQLAYQKNKEDGEILKSYIDAIQYIKIFGDGAFEGKDFTQAEIIYDLLLRNFPRFSDFTNLLSFERNLLMTRLGLSRTLGVEKQVQSCLKTGDFHKAIDVCRNLHLRYPQDTILRDRYIRTLESIKGRADATFRNNEMALAGWIYTILRKNHPSQTYLARLLSYKTDLLDTKARTCLKILFENGLKQYRSGNLPQAISIWKSILTFDPENPEVRRAVETATFQSRRLREDKAYDAK